MLKVPERYDFMTKRKVYSSMIKMIMEIIRKNAWKGEFILNDLHIPF